MTLFKALLAQLLGLGFAIGLLEWLPILPRDKVVFVLIQCLTAALSSRLLRQPPWWIGIHMLFFPAVMLMLNQTIAAEWYLGMVVLMMLVFWGTIKGDVPLFLSSGAVAETVKTIVTEEQARIFGEFGAGIGSVTIPLAKQLPRLEIDAFELAPIPWFINTLRSRNHLAIKSYRKSFWLCDFGRYDVVFAFLSPAVMPELGSKVRLAMRPGTLFISSSFPVPDWEPEFIRDVNDRLGTKLYGYRIGFYLD